ncbi:MAG: DUF1295 domain-containing protein [Rhizobiaceae bacterium]
MIAVLVFCAIALAVVMAGVASFALRTGRTGFIDAVWSGATGLAATAAILLATASAPTGRQWLAAALMAAWTLRLGGHILARSVRHGADPRYAHLLAGWGKAAPRRLHLFLQVQALCGFVLVVAVVAAALRTGPLGIADMAGAASAAVGLLGSFTADRQMERFRAANAGGNAICDKGLWSWSRHPNYVFEWVFWLAWPLLGGLALNGLVALAAPILMYALLRHASGVPHLEAHLRRSRPAAFAAYKARVPVFFPWSKP